MSGSWIDYETLSSRNQVIKYYEEEDAHALKEIQMLELFKHPNVMSLISTTRIVPKNYDLDTCVGIIMNREDSDLSTFLIERGQILTAPQRLSFVQQIALGLEYIHSLDIIHTDLKSENILITDQIVKITDFSSSEFVNKETQVLQTKRLKCTATHRPPEGFWQYICDVDDAEYFEYDKSFDVWSFAIVVLEIMVGVPMYRQGVFPPYRGKKHQDEYDRDIYDIINSLDFYRYAKRYIPSYLLKCLELSSSERPTMSVIKSKLF